MGLERKAAVAVAFVLGGCAIPQYSTRMVPFSASPQASRDQAIAICRPQAQLAATQARNDAQARANAQNSQFTTYNCTTTGTGPNGYRTYSSNCAPQPGGPSPLAAFAQGMDIGASGDNAATAVLTSCLAQYGWRLEQYCIANCR
jgi:hypothetical protein